MRIFKAFLTTKRKIHTPEINHSKHSCYYITYVNVKESLHFDQCFPLFRMIVRTIVFINVIYQLVLVIKAQCVPCEEDLNVSVLLRQTSGVKGFILL